MTGLRDLGDPMPEEDLELDDDENEPNPNEAKKYERLLNKANKQQAEAEARALAAERKLVVAEAGLRLSPVQLNALSAVHDGEWTAESLAQTATDLGFVKAPEEPQTDPQPDLSAYQRLNQAAQGGQEAPKEDMLAAIQNAQNENDVLTIMEKLGRSTTRTAQ